MNLFAPKSYIIKHKILDFLCTEKMKNGGMNPQKDYEFTISEISDKIGYSFEDINNNLDYLYYKKYIHTKKNDNEKTNPYCFALDKGVESNSFKEIINKGKSIQSSVFNNFASGFFQIIVGLIAVFSFIITMSNNNNQKKEIELLNKKLESEQEEIKELKSHFQEVYRAFYKKEDNQTNTQFDDKETK